MGIEGLVKRFNKSDFARSLRRSQKELNLALLVCILLVLAIELGFRQFNLFNSDDFAAGRLVKLIENLALAYVASYIFFFVADFRIKEEDSVNMAFHTEHHLAVVLFRFTLLCRDAMHSEHNRAMRMRYRFFLESADEVPAVDQSYYMAVPEILNGPWAKSYLAESLESIVELEKYYLFLPSKLLADLLVTKRAIQALQLSTGPHRINGFSEYANSIRSIYESLNPEYEHIRDRVLQEVVYDIRFVQNNGIAP